MLTKLWRDEQKEMGCSGALGVTVWQLQLLSLATH